MNGWTKEVTINIIKNNIANIQKSYEDFKRSTVTVEKETLEFLEGLLEQIPNALSGPLIPKTPKVPRKRDLKRIQTIPEDDVADDEKKRESATADETARMAEQTCDEAPSTRSRRAASQRAAQSIKVQQSLGLSTKLRRPSYGADPVVGSIKSTGRTNRAKRTKSTIESSDEEESKRPVKFSKTKAKTEDRETDCTSLELLVPKVEPDETYVRESRSKKKLSPSISKNRASKRQREKSDEMGVEMLQSTRDSEKTWRQPTAKRANLANDTENVPENTNTTMEASLYEDAIGKSIPMNSTMNPNTSVTIDRKMMNVTVVLEAMKMPLQMNETVTINRAADSNRNSDANATLVNEEQEYPTVEQVVSDSPCVPNSVLRSKASLQSKMKALKNTYANPEFDALITEDESSPEKQNEDATKKRKKSGTVEVKEPKCFTRSSLLSEEDDDEDVFEVTATPPPQQKGTLRDVNGLKSVKNAYKSNALFSPYSKESVKKRVEAFEQVGLNSPKAVEIDAPARLTRTKTRAMIAAAAETNFTQIGQSVAQKAARKSLSRAKEIAKMKERKENEEGKENNVLNSAQKPSRLLAMSEKMAQKMQQKTTPVSKSRLQMPMSVNRILHTPANDQILKQNKALTASKSNIITSVDSFIQPARMLTKSSSNDNLAEKRKKINDEDAKRKREETLKALTEEKRKKREEKELKIKLAREAKEKLDMEKRLKQEREREEKARTALLLQERQREEAERKRLIQLQRAQEKEERRRQEEQLRLLRLQEQEEAERQLAEQKRREQEAERRKIAEARAQQAAAAEAARHKAQYLAKAKNAKQQDPSSYVLDSEPDDDESDDESRPKHVIPYWAQSSVRATQLAIQQYIPTSAVLAFFGAKRCTPDLTELFKGIRKERLQRTSSAIWKTPPRYSMMMNE